MVKARCVRDADLHELLERETSQNGTADTVAVDQVMGTEVEELQTVMWCYDRRWNSKRTRLPTVVRPNFPFLSCPSTHFG
jgi:hypothetical protein